MTPKGRLSRADDPEAVVTWPDCPHNYSVLREAGQDCLPLSHLVEWAHETDVHKSEWLGAGGVRLIREWSRIHELPKQLHEARYHDERKKERANG